MLNNRTGRTLLGCAVLLLPWVCTLQAGSVTDVKIDIPYKKSVLKNGLTVLVHEDHKAPIVAVNVWYHVGSKNEQPGKTGFAHLFEHLMFTGSENFKGSGNMRAFLEAMERIGATDMNGTTSEDRTDYFENVPRNALDVALWLESDRMGHFLGAIDQTRLDAQRGVVQNEKRFRYDNQPYGVTDELLTKGTAPPGHPYSWTVIGSMEDLNAASLEDVRNWFKTYYGAANTVLVLAGDIDPDTGFKKAEQYFGDIPAGPPVARYNQCIPRITGTRRQRVSDRVPQARLYKAWTLPAYGEAEAVYLELAADVLSAGKSSRLYKRLVYDDQIATDVSASVDAREISGLLLITATAKPGEDLAKVEKVVDEELKRFLAQGPTAEELQRAKAGKLAGFIRGIERIGGFGGKSDILAMNQTFRGDPEFYQTVLQLERQATPEDLQQAARKWVTANVYVLEVHPYPAYETVAGNVDRSRLPTAGSPPELKFPALQRTKLSNGLKVILAERHAIPDVKFNLQIDAGSASDQFATPGTARLAMSMLNEGTARRTAFQISEELAVLGAGLNTGSGLDSSEVSLSTLTATLDQALDVYADVILNPVFPQASVQRLQQELLAAIEQERNNPMTMIPRILPRLLYGSGHAYGNPGTGSGTEASVMKLTRADMMTFHKTWFKPNNATLIVVGDTTLNDLTPKLEKLFGGWKFGEVPVKNISGVDPVKQTAVYLIDRPGAPQSMVSAVSLTPPKDDPAEIAINTMNLILSGGLTTFTSRINLNLREDKHWSFAAVGWIVDTRGQGAFATAAAVQTDKTKESMVEMDKELRGILGSIPLTADELAKSQETQTLNLPGKWETLDAVATSIGEIVRFSLPDDYFITFPDKVRALSVADVVKAAQQVIHPDQLIWMVIGDRAKIEPGLRELGWGEIHLLDADGNSLKSETAVGTAGVVPDPHGLVAKVKAMVEAHNRHDLEKELSFYAEDARFELVGAWVKDGKAELRKLSELDILYNNQLTLTDFKIEGDTVTCKVREQGDFMKIGGVAIDYDYARLVFRDGLIKEVRAKQSAESVAAVNQQYAMFMGWASANCPQELAELKVGGEPQYMRENAAKWLVLAREWWQAKGAMQNAFKEIQRHLAQKDYPTACRIARTFSDLYAKDAILLNELAWTLAKTEGINAECLNLAETLAVRANEATGNKNANSLDTLARVLFLKGDREKAIATQQKAVECASSERKAGFEKVLDSYKEGKLPPPE